MNRQPTLHLTFHVQPRARRTETAGWHGDAIKIRVAAPPIGGAANEELLRFLADRLGVARAAVELAAGARGRRKWVAIRSVARDEALRKLGIGQRGAEDRSGIASDAPPPHGP